MKLSVSCNRMDEIAYHFSFTYFKMLSDAWAHGGALQQMMCLYEDHSVSEYAAAAGAVDWSC